MDIIFISQVLHVLKLAQRDFSRKIKNVMNVQIIVGHVKIKRIIVFLAIKVSLGLKIIEHFASYNYVFIFY